MKKQIYVATFLLLFLSSIQIANAAGVSVSPVFITVSNLMRGMEFNTTVTVYNPSDYEETYAINITGDNINWISFHSINNWSRQINTITIPANSSGKFIANFKIPTDAANGKYLSEIVVGYLTGATEEDVTSSLSVKVPIKVSLKVVGEQFESGRVINITTMDTEINQLLRINVEFQSTGTVTATPRIEVSIKKNDVEVANFTYNTTKVNVNITDIINVEWDTIGQTVGDYKANVKVYVSDNLIEGKNLDFKILDRGTLTAEGTISNVSAPTEIDLGQLAKIEVQFQNTGKIDIMAKISGEVYYDNKLSDTISGDEVLVKLGETDILTSYFKPTNTGNYLIKSNVVYEGKNASMDPITITVKSSGLSTGEFILTELANPVGLALISILIIAIVVVAILIRKSKF